VHSFRKTNGANGESTVNGVEDRFAGEQTPSSLPTREAATFDQSQTLGFDVVTNTTTAAVTSSDVVSSAVSTAAVSDPSATPVPASSPLHYFIKIDGVNGDTTLNGSAGWLSVDGFDWGLQSSATVGSAGGAGAGKATFSPLTIDIHSLAGLAALFKDAATGAHVKSAELVGVETLKGKSLEVYKVDLTDVQVGSFQQDPGSQGVETTLALDFAKIKITDQPQTANGKLGTPETASFDVVGNTTTAAVTLSPSDLVFDPQLNQSAPMAPGNLGSSGSGDPLHPALMATSS
jgi:type VI protein secretion system component Hcp